MEKFATVFVVLFSLHCLVLSIPAHYPAPFTGSGCTFEDARLCEFEQDDRDSFNWTHRAGPTPNSGTGPDVDHTYSTANGHYMYADGSGQQSGDIAGLRSAYHVNTNNAPICVQFWTHLFGAQMGTLSVYLEDGIGGGPGRRREIFRKTGDHGNNWQLTEIQMQTTPSIFRVVFEATVKGSSESDMAIDDFTITEGPVCLSARNPTTSPAATKSPSITSTSTVPSTSTAPPPITTASTSTTPTPTTAFTSTSPPPTTASTSVAPPPSTESTSTAPPPTTTVSSMAGVTCDFEQDLCGWRQETTDNGDWQIVHGINALRHPTRYLQVRAPSVPRPGHRFRLRSSSFYARTQHRCLSLGYALIGQDVGSLAVYYGTNQNDLAVWIDRVSGTGAWKETRVTMGPVTGSNVTWVVIEAVLGTGDSGEIRLNNTQLTDGQCA